MTKQAPQVPPTTYVCFHIKVHSLNTDVNSLTNGSSLGDTVSSNVLEIRQTTLNHQMLFIFIATEDCE